MYRPTSNCTRRQLATPCTSMSRMQILPAALTRSTAAKEVPYRLPWTLALSTNFPAAISASIAGLSAKL
jgi:hypothetical protein